jgi:20S proteasome alpha/beta subunit
MTIAAGLLYNGGVLMCADTMMSKPTISSFESKIMGYKFDDGIALFAFAGDVQLAENAIQQCEDVLKSAPKVPRTKAALAHSIRTVLKYEYEERILKYNLTGTAFDYSVIVAVCSKADGISLYKTHLSALSRSRKGYEIIGTGDDLAEYVIRDNYIARGHDVRYVTALMTFALAEIKAFMPSSVGGNMIILRLSNEGEPDIVPEATVGIISRHSRLINALMQTLPLSFINGPTRDDFKASLENFSSLALFQWDQFAREAGSLVWAAPPRESWELLTELRPPRDRRSPKSPKGDQKYPPPSPESPGGSSES